MVVPPPSQGRQDEAAQPNPVVADLLPPKEFGGRASGGAYDPETGLLFLVWVQAYTEGGDDKESRPVLTVKEAKK